MLTSGRRAALPRHRTVQAVLDWSYELLPEAEQHLLRHLAIFSDGFTVEAAAAVVNDGGADPSLVLDGITNLVAKSLVALDRDTPPALVFVGDDPRLRAGEARRSWRTRYGGAPPGHVFSRSLFTVSGGIRCKRFRGRADGLGSRDRQRSCRARLCFSAGGDTSIGVDLAAFYAGWFRVDVATSTVDTTRGARQSLDLLTKALDTAHALDDLDAQARALVGVITHHSFSAEHDRARAAAERLLRVADRTGNAALSRNAEGLIGSALVMVGRPREARGFLKDS